MITSSTFIPSQRVKDLLCELFVEYGCWSLAPRLILIELRKELGAEEFARFEKDLARLLEKYPARRAVAKIICAAIKRSNRTYEVTQIEPGEHRLLRQIYQPA
jgi:hypothetical protein